jgi:hypothetical protein
MLTRIALLVLGLLLASPVIADDGLKALRPAELCRQSTAVVRAQWLHGAFDASSTISSLMVDAM